MKNVVHHHGRALKPAGPPSASNPPSLAEKFFDVTMTGEVIPGQDPTAVAHRLAKLLRLPLDEARNLVAGRAITLKSNTPSVIALRYMHALNNVGAVARIIPVTAKQKWADAPAQAATAGPTKQPTNPPASKKERSNDAQEAAAPEELSTPLLIKKLDFRLIPAHIDVGETLRLLAVAAGVLALPALYLLLICAVSLGTIWHAAIHFDWIVGDLSPLLWIPYLTPIVAGAVISALLIKPLVAPVAPPPSAMKFSHEREPLLYTFVESIAHAVSAPVPEEIAYSWQSSLVADANGGILASFRRRVRLVIGLPVLGSLSMTQLASLIAMELARFSNRPHYRLVYLIDAVHLMLYHSAHEDDYWDSRLELAARNNEGTLALCLVALQGIVALSRLPMKALNAACEVISTDTLFQLRINSDRYAAALAGAKEARLALTRIEALNAAQPLVVDEIFHRWQTGKRTARIPQVIIEQSHNLPAHALISIRNSANTRSRGPLGIYPALKRRFNALSVLPQHGLVDLPGAATQLVAAYESLCAVATQEYFDAMAVYHGANVQRPGASRANIQREERQDLLLKHYFRGTFHPDRFLAPELRDSLSLVSVSGATKELQRLRANIEARMEAYARDLAHYDAQRRGTPRNRSIYSAASASGLFRTSTNPKAVNVHNAHTGRVSEEQLEQQLWRFESLVEKRMGIALSIALTHADANKRAQIETQLSTQKLLGRAKPMIDNLMHFANVVHHGLHPAPGKPTMAAAELRRQMSRCRDAYISLLAFLCQGQFPFQGGNNPDYIASYFQHSAGHPDDMLRDPELCVANVHAVMQNVHALHRMVVSGLVEFAARGESELSLHASPRGQLPPDSDSQLASIF